MLWMVVGFLVKSVTMVSVIVVFGMWFMFMFILCSVLLVMVTVFGC